MNHVEWKEQAQSLFDNSAEGLAVDGVKFGIPADETRNFWTCAPPKVNTTIRTILIHQPRQSCVTHITNLIWLFFICFCFHKPDANVNR